MIIRSPEVNISGYVMERYILMDHVQAQVLNHVVIRYLKILNQTR